MDINGICTLLRIDALARGLQIVDAQHLARLHAPPLDPDLPALIARVDSDAIAQECQRVLLLLYPRDHVLTHVEGKVQKQAKLGALQVAETPGVLYVPPLARPSSFNTLANITTHLRAPNGCPWDRAQTHQSLRKDFLEECYEVLDTLDRNDIPHLREELGDLLLHILLQTQIACEAGEFGLSDVIAGIAEKLVRRHPHVFGNVKVSGTAEIRANWERIKNSEYGGERTIEKEIPRALPALARAQKIAEKEKKRTSQREIERLIRKLPRSRKKEQALGEILFALAVFAESKGVDAEAALRARTI